jgi:hypothetical protein
MVAADTADAMSAMFCVVLLGTNTEAVASLVLIEKGKLVRIHLLY